MEGSNGDGHTYLIIVYFIFAFANLFAPSVVSLCGPKKTLLSGINSVYLLDVLWGQPIMLIQVVSTSEFHEY